MKRVRLVDLIRIYSGKSPIIKIDNEDKDKAGTEKEKNPYSIDKPKQGSTKPKIDENEEDDDEI